MSDTGSQWNTLSDAIAAQGSAGGARHVNAQAATDALNARLAEGVVERGEHIMAPNAQTNQLLASNDALSGVFTENTNLAQAAYGREMDRITSNNEAFFQQLAASAPMMEAQGRREAEVEMARLEEARAAREFAALQRTWAIEDREAEKAAEEAGVEIVAAPSGFHEVAAEYGYDEAQVEEMLNREVVPLSINDAGELVPDPASAINVHAALSEVAFNTLAAGQEAQIPQEELIAQLDIAIMTAVGDLETESGGKLDAYNDIARIVADRYRPAVGTPRRSTSQDFLTFVGAPGGVSMAPAAPEASPESSPGLATIEHRAHNLPGSPEAQAAMDASGIGQPLSAPSVENLNNPLINPAEPGSEELATNPGVESKLRSDYSDFLIRNGWGDSDDSGQIDAEEYGDAPLDTKSKLQVIGNVLNAISLDAGTDKVAAGNQAEEWADRVAQSHGIDISKEELFLMYEEFGSVPGDLEGYDTGPTPPITEGEQEINYSEFATPMGSMNDQGSFEPSDSLDAFLQDAANMRIASELAAPGAGTALEGSLVGPDPAAVTSMFIGQLANVEDALGTSVGSEGLDAALLDAAGPITAELFEQGINLTPADLVNLYYAVR